MGQPTTGGQRGGGDGGGAFGSDGLRPFLRRASGRHVPDLRVRPLADGWYVSWIWERHLTRVGGCLSRWTLCGSCDMLGSESVGPYLDTPCERCHGEYVYHVQLSNLVQDLMTRLEAMKEPLTTRHCVLADQ